MRTEEVDRLPSLTRDFTQLANLTPGVTVAANNVTIGNGPATSTGFQVDGTSMQAPTIGGVAIQLVQDWIQEFSVLSSQFPVEFGNAQNGVVNAVTRSGSNRTQGRVFGYFQDEALNATLWRATTKNPFGQQRSGAQVGGPILRDRLLYFVGYERNHSLTNIPVSISPIFVGNVPDVTLNAAGTQAVGTVEQDTVVHSIIAKVDYRPESAHTVTPRVIVRKFNQSANGSATATNVPLTASRGPQYQLNDSSQVAWTWVMSSSSLLDTRVEFRRNHLQNGCFAAPSLFGWPTSLTALNVPTFVYPSGGPTIGCNGRWGDAFEEGWFLNEAFTTNRGPHTLKFGGVFVRPVNHVVETQNQSGRYTMPRVELFSEANPLTYPLAYALSFEPGEHPGWALGGSQFGLFAQDTWRLGQELTLSLGIRYDAEAKVSTINEDVDSMKPPYNTHLNHVNPNLGNVAPRLGSTWAPGGSGRVAIRGGFGMFYDTAKNATFAGWAGQVGNPLFPGGALMNIASNNATLNPYCLGNTRCVGGVPADLQNALRQVMAFAIITNTVPNLAATSVTVNGVTTALPGVAVSPIPLSVGHIEENLKTPFTRQETIGAQFDLGKGFSASADLKFIQGRDQYILRNVNLTTEGRIVDPVFQSLNKLGNGGVLDVKQLLMEVGYRSARRQMQVAYALGSASNNSIGNLANGIGQTPATNPFDYSVDQGPASSDQLHILNVSGNVELPWGIKSRAALQSDERYQSESGYQRTSVPGAGLSGVLQPMLPIQHHGRRGGRSQLVYRRAELDAECASVEAGAVRYAESHGNDRGVQPDQPGQLHRVQRQHRRNDGAGDGLERHCAECGRPDAPGPDWVPIRLLDGVVHYAIPHRACHHAPAWRSVARPSFGHHVRPDEASHSQRQGEGVHLHEPARDHSDYRGRRQGAGRGLEHRSRLHAGAGAVWMEKVEPQVRRHRHDRRTAAQGWPSWRPAGAGDAR